MSDVPTPMTLTAQWLVDNTMTSSLANQVLVQFEELSSGQPEGVYLTFGHVNPPVFTMAPGQVQPSPEMVDATILPVVPVARIYVGLDRLKAILGEISARIDLAEQSAAARPEQ